MYRHAFYRGGSHSDKCLKRCGAGTLGISQGSHSVFLSINFSVGPTRDRIRLYKGGGDPEGIKAWIDKGFTAFKTGPAGGRPARIIENKAFIDRAVNHFAALREAAGTEVDLAIDFHGAVSPQTAKVLIKALEPYQPMFIEEPIQCQNVDTLAEIARSTHIPIATGERVFTKWGVP